MRFANVSIQFVFTFDTTYQLYRNCGSIHEYLTPMPLSLYFCYKIHFFISM